MIDRTFRISLYVYAKDEIPKQELGEIHVSVFGGAKESIQARG